MKAIQFIDSNKNKQSIQKVTNIANANQHQHKYVSDSPNSQPQDNKPKELNKLHQGGKFGKKREQRLRKSHSLIIDKEEKFNMIIAENTL